MGDKGFFAPVQYNGGWVLLGALILLAIVAFYVLVPLLTRPRRVPLEPTTPWIPPETPDQMADRYLALIDVVESKYSRGEVNARVAHQRLSQLLRFFAWERSGVRAPQMTLAELRESNAQRDNNRDVSLRDLAWAVEGYYPASFGPQDYASVSEALRNARRVVREWT